MVRSQVSFGRQLSRSLLVLACRPLGHLRRQKCADARLRSPLRNSRNSCMCPRDYLSNANTRRRRLGATMSPSIGLVVWAILITCTSRGRSAPFLVMEGLATIHSRIAVRYAIWRFPQPRLVPFLQCIGTAIDCCSEPTQTEDKRQGK